jgi:hypothetical protein
MKDKEKIRQSDKKKSKGRQGRKRNQQRQANGMMRDREGKRNTNKTVAVTCGYSRPNCEREFTELVTFEVYE